MQVEIDEVVSRIRALDRGTVLAPETLEHIVRAVLEAVEQRERGMANRQEEQSMQNHQQRNRPWAR